MLGVRYRCVWQWFFSRDWRFSGSETGEVLLSGVGTLRQLLSIECTCAPASLVVSQSTPTSDFLGAGFLGVPPIFLKIRDSEDALRAPTSWVDAVGNLAESSW